MVKRDLFRLLEERQSGGTPSGTRSGTSRRQADGGGLRGWWEQLVAPLRASRPAARRQAAPRRHFGGLGVAVLVLFALGAGFLLGRYLPRGDGEVLRVPEVGQQPERPLPQRPGPLGRDAPPQGAVPDLTPEKAQEVLPLPYFPTLVFPAPQLEEATRVASYLLRNGVDNARVRPMKSRGNPVWVVVAYTAAGAAEDTLSVLKAVPAARTWPQLAPTLRSLTTDLLRPAAGS